MIRHLLRKQRREPKNAAGFYVCGRLCDAWLHHGLSPRSRAGSNIAAAGCQPVTTKIIKRCPDGRELMIRANGRYGCAKDIVPPND
jgi:hypothetical protein